MVALEHVVGIAVVVGMACVIGAVVGQAARSFAGMFGEIEPETGDGENQDLDVYG